MTRRLPFPVARRAGPPGLVLAAAWLLAAAGAAGVPFEARFAWVDGRPRLDLLVTPATPPADAAAEATVPLRVYDAKDILVWQTEVKLTPSPQGPWTGSATLEQPVEFKQAHRLEVSLRDDRLGVDAAETLYFTRPDSGLWSHGIRRCGTYPAHQVFVTLALRDFRGGDGHELPVHVAVFDADENSVLDLPGAVTPGPRPSWHALEITPPAGGKAIGPFRADVSIESDAYALFLNTSLPFAAPNALLPVTGFEHGDGTLWFAADAEPPRPEHSLQYYYTPQLTDLQVRAYPGIVFDRAEKHSGRQALRLDYRRGERAHLWSRQTLPGKPMALTVWVKGNGVPDQLWVTFEDFINYTLPAWQRNANFSRALVCTLDFDGWRRFRVPVLGDGLQVTGLKGSSPAIDAPVLLTALTVQPAPLPRGEARGAPLQLWLDDLAVETQVAPTDLVTIELQGSQPDGELLPDGQLYAAVATGTATDLRQGRLSLTARDAAGEVVWTVAQELPVPAGQTAVAHVPLADLAAKRPRGPVEIEAAFADAATPGARASARLTLKHATQGGLCFDFETPESYNGFAFRQDHPHQTPDLRILPTQAAIVAGGAEGSAHALRLPVGVNPADVNGLLLHPALPGQLDRITLSVKGDGKPVRLQIWFLDSGNTGVWLRPFNLFWAEPITVDWTDWRTLTVKAPPIPPDYHDRNRWFYRRPWYPLNLAVYAQCVGEAPQPATLWLDHVRVLTHLATAEELSLEPAYPDDSRIHRPGMPLQLRVRNLAAAARDVTLTWRLRSYQGHDVAQDTLKATVPAGTGQFITLVPQLAAGIYELTLDRPGAEPLREPVMVLDPTPVLGPEPLATLRDPAALRRRLGLLSEKVYLDWDNTEPTPNTFQFGWFNQILDTRGDGGRFRLVPVLGFCADWAGPEATESLQKETYSRYIPNLFQVPARLVDWSAFVRECAREYRGRFDEWVFWENPDIDGAPQFIPPAVYGPMLGVVHQWVKRYSPQARVTAGGFNFNRVLDYLERIPAPHALPFDDLAVQMNIGELSPEAVDLEGFLDELETLLRLRENGRRVQTAELDWGIGPFLSPLEQAAYHARAAMILNSRGALPHQFSLANGGFEFPGYGTFYRLPYGATCPQLTLKPVYVPKPSFFIHTALQRFLETNRFLASVAPPDRSLDFNRAFLYQGQDGALTTALWRAVPGERRYRRPAAWKDAVATDAFGFPALAAGDLVCGTLPVFLRFPAGTRADDLAHDLRHLEPLDARFAVLADLPVADAAAAARHGYRATGTLGRDTRGGLIPGAFKLRSTFLTGLTAEEFTFRLATPGNVLLRRRWYMDEAGQKLSLQLDDGAPLPWDLTPGEGHQPGLRESTYVLRNVPAGPHRVRIAYETPGNCAGYRLEPAGPEYLELTRCGMLNARQTQGAVQPFRSAVGTPLRLGRQTFEDGLGAHAVSFIEYPLDGQYSALEVTVGIDAQTEGRGSVLFRVFVDGRERANSGTMSGFTASKTLRVDGLAGARRLILSVTDAGDGSRNDLANWVDGKLYLK